MRRWGTAVLFSLLLLFLAQRLSAHGGGALVAGPVAAGPYIVSVWLNPPQPRAGEPLHYTVGLAAPEDRSPILDAEVLVTMTPTPAGSPIRAMATTEQSINRLFYETDMEVPAAGQYEALFEINGPQGAGQISLAVDVNPAGGVNWLWVGLGGLGLVLLLGWLRARRMPAG